MNQAIPLLGYCEIKGYRNPSGERTLAFGYQSWSSNHLHHANIRDNCN
jgi:hypothetical protein